MFGIEPICRVLTSHGLKIATSTYYAAGKRAPSARSLRDAQLKTQISETSPAARPRSARPAAPHAAGRTPASFQSRSRRQHVRPEPKPSSCGRYSHWIPVCSTYRTPHSTSRSRNGLPSGYRTCARAAPATAQRDPTARPTRSTATSPHPLNAQLPPWTRQPGPIHLIVQAAVSHHPDHNVQLTA